jgi:Polyketide cyclase / dehydrase and lipid transport
MSSLTVRAHGPAAAADVWEAYADPQRWPEWAPHIRRVDAIGRLRPGLTGQVWSVLPAPVTFEVKDVDAKRRRWSWQAALGPVRMRFEHGVDSRDIGCATWLVMRGPLPLLALYAPVARLALYRLVRTPVSAELRAQRHI